MESDKEMESLICDGNSSSVRQISECYQWNQRFNKLTALDDR